MAPDDLLTPWGRFRRWRWWWQAFAWVVLPPLPVGIWAASQPRRGRGVAWGLVALVAGAWLTVAWAWPDTKTATGADGQPATVPSTTTTDAAPSTTATAPTTTTTAPATSSTASIVDQLVVTPEISDAGYDRDLFNHWIDGDGDGCDTRCEVLEAERRVDLPGLRSGGWLSIYDGYSTPDASELDVDHVVALGEAWRSGAAGWDPARRQAFANDLDEPRALVAVTAATNRSKSDRDPVSWQPPNQAAWCEFATSWAVTKVRWGLTADQAEVDALRNMLRTC